MSEVEKLKAIATNTKLNSWERVKAQDALSEVGNREAMLALMDVAGSEKLYSWERDAALTKAREILKREVK